MKVKEWLPDRYLMLKEAWGTDVVFRGLWDIECDSEAQAKQRINCRIEAWQSWLKGLGYYSTQDLKQIEEDSNTLTNEQIYRSHTLREVS